jgi:siroheme synthase
LQSADVIFFDNGSALHVLDFARREAKKISVDMNAPSSRPEDVKVQMIDLAKSGNRVVRLSNGDATNSASTEAETCRTAGVAVEIVPALAARI